VATATIPIPEPSSPWIEIFRAGDYRSKGKGLVTREDLARVAEGYDPAYHEAPVTVSSAPIQLGHRDDAPAFGWIDSLALQGDVLVAREKQVDPQFNELRKAGRYKKRSASFYVGADGRVSGLRHVAYLGAEPPEVKGLKDVKFEDNGREFIEVNFGEEDQVVAEKTVAEQIGDFFREHFGGTPKTFTESDVTALVTSAVNTAVTAAVDPLKAQIAAQKTQFSERESKIATSELEAGAQAAIARLKAKGKWIPAFDKMGADLLFTELAGATNTVEFGEGDAKKTLTPLQLFENFMEGLPAIVPAGTKFDGKAAGLATMVTNYGEKADQNSVQLHELATKRANDNKISYGEALTQVAIENPTLTKPGCASAGQV